MTAPQCFSLKQTPPVYSPHHSFLTSNELLREEVEVISFLSKSIRRSHSFRLEKYLECFTKHGTKQWKLKGRTEFCHCFSLEIRQAIAKSWPTGENREIGWKNKRPTKKKKKKLLQETSFSIKTGMRTVPPPYLQTNTPLSVSLSQNLW